MRNSQIIASSLLSLQNTWGKSKISSCCLIAKSCPTLAITWTVAYQACLSMQFPRQEYWSVLPFPPPGDLPDPGMEPSFPCIAGGFFMSEPPGKLKVSQTMVYLQKNKKPSDPRSIPWGFTQRAHTSFVLKLIARCISTQYMEIFTLFFSEKLLI